MYIHAYVFGLQMTKVTAMYLEMAIQEEEKEVSKQASSRQYNSNTPAAATQSILQKNPKRL